MLRDAGVVYVGFWARVVASLIDGAVAFALPVFVLARLGVPGAVFGMVNGTNADGSTGQTFTVRVGGWSALVALAILVVYFGVLKSSRYQASVGKLVIGARVTDLDGNRISLGRAVGRYLAKFISAVLLFAGFVMVAFTERKQGLHNKIASTTVRRSRP